MKLSSKVLVDRVGDTTPVLGCWGYSLGAGTDSTNVDGAHDDLEAGYLFKIVQVYQSVNRKSLTRQD